MKTLTELEQAPDDDLRVMLAELAGWENTTADGFFIGRSPNGGGYAELPNYPQDLNACREVALTLDREQKNRYINRLSEDVQEDHMDAVDLDFAWCEASARQRTIALILTLQKP